MKLGYLLVIFSLLSSSIFTYQPTQHENHILEEVHIKEERAVEVLDGSSPVIEDIINDKKVEVSLFVVDGLALKQGISNEEVIRIKRFLKEKGYENITEDYYFDKNTSEAITKYKIANGLVANGIIDSITFQKINEDIEKNKIILPELELKFTDEIPKDNWIVINKSNNTLYHLNGNEILKKYPVATGKTAGHTPVGKFSIVTKYINPAWGGAGIYKPVKGGAPNNPLGKRWMGLSIKGGGTYGIHGNSDSSSIGKYITLGCVRMFNHDIESLYDIINYGTPVWIGNEAELKEFGLLFDFQIYLDLATKLY